MVDPTWLDSNTRLGSATNAEEQPSTSETPGSAAGVELFLGQPDPPLILPRSQCLIPLGFDVQALEFGSASAGQTVADGEGGVTANCSVNEAFDFTTVVVGILRGPGDLNFRIDFASPLSDSSTQEVDRMEFSVSTLERLVPYQDRPCTLSPATRIGSDGWIARLDCPLLYNPRVTAGGCALFGMVAVERCDD
jgi:hypothetical protein